MPDLALPADATFPERAGIINDGGGHWTRRHGRMCWADFPEGCVRDDSRRRCQCVDRKGRDCCAPMDAEDLLCAACRAWCPVEPPPFTAMPTR